MVKLIEGSIVHNEMASLTNRKVPMIAITGCEKSRAVANAIEQCGSVGDLAYSIDLEPCYEAGHPRHIQGDLFEVLAAWRGSGRPAASLGLFFPECRCLCSSGQHRTGKPGQRTVADVEAAVRFFMRCVEVAETLPVAVIENSIGIMSRLWCAPTQIIQPYQFGEDASKGTCFWVWCRGKWLSAAEFRLEFTEFVPPRMVCGDCGGVTKWQEEFGRWKVQKQVCESCSGGMLPRWSNQTNSGQNKLPPSAERSAKRADFYPGVARALVEQIKVLGLGLGLELEV